MKQSSSDRISRIWLPAGVLLIGALLLAAALWHPSSAKLPEWVAINADVGLALDALEQGKEPPAAGAGSQSAADAPRPNKASGQAGDADAVKGSVMAGQGAGAVTGATAGSGVSSSLPDGGQTSSAGQSGSGQAASGGPGSGQTPSAGENGSAQPAGSAGTTETGQTGQSSAPPDGRIDINHASAEELDALPGIGEAKAKTIVEDRDKNGLFRSADDLLRVKGIGPKMLEKIKSSIVVNP